VKVAQEVASKTANASLGTAAEELRARVTEIQINNTNYISGISWQFLYPVY
jgi:hypothetical protein